MSKTKYKSKIFRAVLLQLIKKAENRTPKKVYKLNVLNSGLVLNSEKIEKGALKIIKHLYK